jgi:hypothetical protein
LTPSGRSACDRHGPATAASYHQQRVCLPRTLSSPRTLAAYRPSWYGCLALGFLARCGAGFSPALHRAPHPARGPSLPGLRSHPGTGDPLCVKMGSAHSSLPGPAYGRAQVAHPIHPVSECHFRVRLGRDAALGPRTLRSAPDLHAIPTRSSLDSHRVARDSHPSRTRISLDPHWAHSRMVPDLHERNYRLIAHPSQVALCAQPIWLRMPLAGRAGPH